MSNPDFDALIGRVALGDRAAFTHLYHASSPKLFAVCLRILRDRTDAEEALQEIYIKIWQRARSFATRSGTATSWLVAIARNHAIDVIRARRPAAQDIDDLSEALDDGAPNPEEVAAIRDEGRRIDDCMKRLQAPQADAVRRAYVEGLSYLELANELKVPLNTVRTWLRRSLLKLRECMEQ